MRVGTFSAWLVVAAFAAPLVAGLLGTLLPAFGVWMPFARAEAHALPLDGFRAVLADPRISGATRLTLFTGLLSTVLVLLLTLLTLVSAHGTRLWRAITSSLPPLLAVPHAAMAVGLAFLLAPSGWLARLFSPWLTGWERPPTGWVIPDGDGWSLIAGLVIKETPFLLLAAAAQLPGLDVEASLRIGRTLGYSPARCWSRLVLPRLYPRIRLSLLVILAFNLSVVDMAILLGPGSPPTLSVLLLGLVNDPATRVFASSGAVLLAGVVLASFLLLLLLERALVAIAAHRRTSGHRGLGLTPARKIGQFVAASVPLVGLAALLMLPIWSIARRWRFPDVLPSQWTLDTWTGRLGRLVDPALDTLGFAIVTTLLALGAAILWLEAERMNRVPRIDGFWYLPLLVPQVSLLFGWQIVALHAGIDGAWGTVLHAHWVYALPYVVLILAVAWRELDPNWGHAASTLGAGYWRVLWCVRMPLLRRPLAQAAAVAASVSVSQYLPTLLLGAGRHQTLAIDLVTGRGGVDRRTLAALALLQGLLPLAAFTMAVLWPRARERRLRHGVRTLSVAARIAD